MVRSGGTGGIDLSGNRDPARKRRRAPAPSARRVVVAFGAVAATFIAATVYSELRATHSDWRAQLVAHKVAPSIARLADARAELRHLQAGLERQVRAVVGRETADLADVRHARRALEQATGAYLASRRLPGEDEPCRALQDALVELDAAADSAIAALLDRRAEDAARIAAGDLDLAVERAHAALVAAMSFNAEYASTLGSDIRMSRRRAGAVAIVLDLLGGIATVAAAAIVLRSLRAHDALVAQRNRLLERQASELEAFAGRVAHDILSPLSTVQLSLDVMSMATDDERAVRAVERGRGAMRLVKRIVEDLLSFARAAAGPPSDARAELRAVAAAVMSDLAEEARTAGATVGGELPEGVWLPCQAGVLASVLGNLVRNAIKFLGDSAEKRVTIRAVSRERRVRVEVCDTGPGIPRHLVEVVFLPHVRGPSAASGLGLGLATVKRLVEAHGGEVGVVTQEGKGATFWFELEVVGAPTDPGGAVPGNE